MGSGRSQRWQSGGQLVGGPVQLRAKNRRGNGLTCKPPTPPWRSPTGGGDLNNYIMILFAQGGRGREWVQQGPCPPTALHHSPPPPNRCRKTGHSFRGPRRPFRAPRHSQPLTHAAHTLGSMWERGEAFGGPWGHGDGRSHGPWVVAEPTNQTPPKSEQGVQKNVRGRVGLIYPLWYPG